MHGLRRDRLAAELQRGLGHEELRPLIFGMHNGRHRENETRDDDDCLNTDLTNEAHGGTFVNRGERRAE